MCLVEVSKVLWPPSSGEQLVCAHPFAWGGQLLTSESSQKISLEVSVLDNANGNLNGNPHDSHVNGQKTAYENANASP